MGRYIVVAQVRLSGGNPSQVGVSEDCRFPKCYMEPMALILSLKEWRTSGTQMLNTSDVIMKFGLRLEFPFAAVESLRVQTQLS